MKENTNKITQVQIDLFKVHTQGAMNNASESLYSLINSDIVIEESSSKIVLLHEFYKVVGNPETIFSTVIMSLSEKLKGFAAVSYSDSDSEKLLSKLLSNKVSDASEEIKKSALEDTANILIGSFFSNLSKKLGISFLQTPPAFSHDMIHASLDEAVFQFASESSDGLIFSSEIRFTEVDACVKILIVLNAESAKLLLGSL